jgi:hypothetical protein
VGRAPPREWSGGSFRAVGPQSWSSCSAASRSVRQPGGVSMRASVAWPAASRAASVSRRGGFGGGDGYRGSANAPTCATIARQFNVHPLGVAECSDPYLFALLIVIGGPVLLVQYLTGMPSQEPAAGVDGRRQVCLPSGGAGGAARGGAALKDGVWERQHRGHNGSRAHRSAVTGWLASTVPPDLRILPADAGLPKLPPCAINLHLARNETRAATMELERHIQNALLRPDPGA